MALGDVAWLALGGNGGTDGHGRVAKRSGEQKYCAVNLLVHECDRCCWISMFSALHLVIASTLPGSFYSLLLLRPILRPCHHLAHRRMSQRHEFLAGLDWAVRHVLSSACSVGTFGSTN